MKKLLVYLSLLLLNITIVSAKDIPHQPSGIERLVTNIKSAKASDRRVLMNQLKVKLRGMNQETRRKTMRDLKKSFATHGGRGHGMHKNRPANYDKNGMHDGRGKQKHKGKNRPNHSPKFDGQKKGK